jgi:ABC-2 type transport system ATP-binding protein
VRAAGGPVAAVEPALVRLGLAGRLRRLPVSRLSAGQRRRVAIAGIAARRPALWLLDEPHAGLDASARQMLDDLVKEEVEAGATVVLASHDNERSAALAHRVVAVSGGRVSAPGGREQGPSTRAPAPTGAAHVA